jgi:hypothetical protein
MFISKDRTTVEAEREARRLSFRVLGPMLLTELQALEPSAGWSLRVPQDDASVNPAFAATTGEQFWLSLDEYRGRIHVHARYGLHADGRPWIPRDAAHDAVSPSPTMDAMKTPAAIARDILRRFLPAYRGHLVTYRTQVAHQQAYHGQTAASFAGLLVAGDGLLRTRTPTPKPGTEGQADFYALSGEVSGDVHVSGTSVRFDRLCLPPALAGDVLRLITAYVEQATPEEA